MNRETAKMLVENLASTLSIALDNRNKLTTLELLLKENDPELFNDYEEMLQKVRRNPPTQVSPVAFEKLVDRLTGA